MPSGPQPCWRDSSRTSQVVSEPVVELLTVLPLRSATVLIGPGVATTRHRSAGLPAIAATPSTGAPLATKLSSGPEPMPISMLFEASPCCSLALPPKLYSSISSPCSLKMPDCMPTSSGVKVKALVTALPTRSFWSAAKALCAISAAATASAATSFHAFFISAHLPERAL